MRTERRPTSTPPQREAPEQLVVRLRRSGRHLVWPALFFIAICFCTGYWWNGFDVAWLNTALPLVAGGLTVLLSLLPLIFWLNRVTVVTTVESRICRDCGLDHALEFPRAAEVG